MQPDQEDGLQNKFRILSTLPFDRRTGRKHLAVMGFIMDWHHRKYGDALASVRHIVAELKARDPFDKGLFTGDVHSALVDLVEWGYLAQQKGSGRRASRYVPNWNSLRSVLTTPNATDADRSVRENQNADVRESQNTTGLSVLEVQNEDPLTVTRLQDGFTERDIDCATPSAPLADGLAATTARTAQGGFEKLWMAYGYRKDKKSAREAYSAIPPDLRDQVLEAAMEWQAAWAAQGNADAPRKHLHTWLTAEDWDCDPPTGFKPKEKKPRQAKANALPKDDSDDDTDDDYPGAANDNEAADRDRYPAVQAWVPRGPSRIEVIGSSVEDVETGQKITLDFTYTAGKHQGDAAKITFRTGSSDEPANSVGLEILKSIQKAMDLPFVQDLEEFWFVPVIMDVAASGAVKFYAHPPVGSAASGH